MRVSVQPAALPEAKQSCQEASIHDNSSIGPERGQYKYLCMGIDDLSQGHLRRQCRALSIVWNKFDRSPDWAREQTLLQAAEDCMLWLLHITAQHWALQYAEHLLDGFCCEERLCSIAFDKAAKNLQNRRCFMNGVNFNTTRTGCLWWFFPSWCASQGL